VPNPNPDSLAVNCGCHLEAVILVIYSPAMTKIATARVSASTASGWQVIAFPDDFKRSLPEGLSYLTVQKVLDGKPDGKAKITRIWNAR
jgi:hypothetical protein